MKVITVWVHCMIDRTHGDGGGGAADDGIDTRVSVERANSAKEAKTIKQQYKSNDNNRCVCGIQL